jgi:hypothetical protein
MQHRREEKEVLRVDQQYFDTRIARHCTFELQSRVKAGESGAEDHDPLAFMAIDWMFCTHICFLDQSRQIEEARIDGAGRDGFARI